ncbi:aldehyde dehydrogenase family protein [Nocardia sp. BMG111209]|uniref:aldehyde dehydrogenase family protein n=1 Tax=Nocardia sp. BMG111209 TaxID=1160137 RepID=UPI00351092E5
MTLPADTDPAGIDRIVTAAVAAAEDLARTTPAQRAAWLHAAADALDAAAGELVELAATETHLPAQPRLRGEMVRTVFQLRLFAEVLTDGEFLRATVDHADPAWPMGPRPDIRRTVVPIGPVLVFAASNFPLTLSVAGHDTAAALAAGCPVVLKAHPGHPRLSARVRDIVVAALTGAGAPAGTFENIYGVEAGATALRHPGIEAASFTGSEAGGRALFDIANARPRPIPFYGELGSVNPVVVTPGAVAARGPEIATGYVGSFTLGAGQFCTKPGLLLLPVGHGLTEALIAAVKAVPAQRMLNDRIADGFRSGVTRLDDHPAVTVLAATAWGADTYLPTLLKVAAADFAPETLGRECFGPSSIVIEYRDIDELRSVLRQRPRPDRHRARRTRRGRHRTHPAPHPDQAGGPPDLERLAHRHHPVLGPAARRPLPGHHRPHRHLHGHRRHRTLPPPRRLAGLPRRVPAPGPARGQPVAVAAPDRRKALVTDSLILTFAISEYTGRSCHQLTRGRRSSGRNVAGFRRYPQIWCHGGCGSVIVDPTKRQRCR